MAGGSNLNQEVLTGWRYWINTTTQRGRANIVYATYGSVFLAYLVIRRRLKRKAELELAKLTDN